MPCPLFNRFESRYTWHSVRSIMTCHTTELLTNVLQLLDQVSCSIDPNH